MESKYWDLIITDTDYDIKEHKSFFKEYLRSAIQQNLLSKVMGSPLLELEFNYWSLPRGLVTLNN